MRQHGLLLVFNDVRQMIFAGELLKDPHRDGASEFDTRTMVGVATRLISVV